MNFKMSITRLITVLLAILVCCPSLFAESNLFQFRNGFWINLHHYLYAQALAGAESVRTPRLKSSAADAIRNAPCQAIPTAQQPAWQQAVKFYATNYISKEWLFDDEMQRLNDLLGSAADSDSPPAGLPPELEKVLKTAAPIYRKSCWPAHKQANAEWLRSLQARLAQHGPALAARLTQLYDAKWPAIVVDVVSYANWAGAYTYDHHITLDSVNPDYQGNSALEMIFH